MFTIYPNIYFYLYIKPFSLWVCGTDLPQKTCLDQFVQHLQESETINNLHFTFTIYLHNLHFKSYIYNLSSQLTFTNYFYKSAEQFFF